MKPTKCEARSWLVDQLNIIVITNIIFNFILNFPYYFYLLYKLKKIFILIFFTF